ncbi:23S rRNA (pseudouridine(1915)-N(3))-methyltransferase RlmH [Cyanobium sp. PCC 7001]|uniref:23S rRNA (pseudouridine(1915)-N(3))-methyltransferase RlmH n=1 Tax=Cyanobium sp. PCC 7001 TaxID=180281 RepID=UPI0005BAD519|nr:23S rRNA (pseudouridine(1915)-N(3))-methyltransferase RlmH [Cyanobium sp. PCC 7001]
MNPGRIRIIAVGKVRKGWVREGVEVYRRRLPGLTIVELKDSDPAREAQAVRAELRSDEQLITLSEEGRPFRSVELAAHLGHCGSDRLAFVIGGADGLDPALRARARWQLSLSALTFPHELARLLLLEQLYRAQTILQGGPYHRE